MIRNKYLSSGCRAADIDYQEFIKGTQSLKHRIQIKLDTNKVRDKNIFSDTVWANSALCVDNWSLQDDGQFSKWLPDFKDKVAKKHTWQVDWYTPSRRIFRPAFLKMASRGRLL